MQKAKIVLSILKRSSLKGKDYTFKRLYRNFYNKDFFLSAYAKLYSKEGNMTSGTDGRTIDGFGYQLIEELIEQLKTETYNPNPVRRTYIPKKNGKMRPLGIPTIQDKLVQEVIRQILESIYEPLFKDSSHGFRKGYSCHTALYQIKTKCAGANWFIEGDIKGFFDNVDHEILIKLLCRKIKDGRFIGLIQKFLKSGYLEFREVHSSLSGTPQGGVISPILSNIYLHELDVFMEELQSQYNTIGKRRKSSEYRSISRKRIRCEKNGDRTQVKELTRQMYNMPSFDPFDKDYMRIRYTRYCDDFIISVAGSKRQAEEIRDKVKSFISSKLNLELNMEKTLITHTVKERAKFLGYEINKSVINTRLTKLSNGKKARRTNGSIQLLVPGEVINDKLKPFRKNDNPVHCNERVNLSVREIIEEYNAEIRGLYNYYNLATDVSTKVGKFLFYHYFSMAKTIAKKEKSGVKKVISKYGIDVQNKSGGGTRKIIGVKYKSRGKEKTLTYYNDSLKRVHHPCKKPQDSITNEKHEIIERLNACTCELCGFCSNEIKYFSVHHVRKLKDEVKKYKGSDRIMPKWLMVMEGIRRKTLVVCKHCHKEIHC